MLGRCAQTGPADSVSDALASNRNRCIRIMKKAELRRLVSALGVERWRQRCKDLAEVLGKNPDVVSDWVVEGVRKRRDDPAFAKCFDEVDEMLENATRLERGRR